MGSNGTPGRNAPLTPRKAGTTVPAWERGSIYYSIEPSIRRGKSAGGIPGISYALGAWGGAAGPGGGVPAPPPAACCCTICTTCTKVIRVS